MNKLHSLGAKFALPFGAILAATAVVGLISYSSMKQLNHDIVRLNSEAVDGSRQMGKLSGEFQRYRLRHYRLVLAAPGKDRDKAVGEVKDSQEKIKALATGIKEKFSDNVNGKDLDDLQNGIAACVDFDNRFWPLLEKGSTQTQFAALDGEFRKLSKGAVEPAIENLSKHQTEVADGIKREASHDSSTAITWVVIGSLIAVLICFACAFWAIRGIVRRAHAIRDKVTEVNERAMAQLNWNLEALQQGDLSRRASIELDTVAVTDCDEIGDAMSALNDMIDSMHENSQYLATGQEGLGTLIQEMTQDGDGVALNSASVLDVTRSCSRLAAEIQTVVDSVVMSVRENGSASHEIAVGSGKLAEAAEASALAMTRLAGLVQHAAEAGRQQHEIAARAASDAHDGGRMVQAMMESLDQVKVKVSDTRNAIRELGDRQEAIAAIAQTIEDIAAQTNLLALNAAIEAARAGEQGRGFSVVAEEVRKLAERTAGATGEISDLISGVNDRLQKSVVGVDESVEVVDEAVSKGGGILSVFHKIGESSETAKEQAASSLEALEKTKALTRDVEETVSQVAAISEEQAAAAQQLSATTQEIGNSSSEITDHALNQRSAMEGASSAAEDLMSKADAMFFKLAKFKLGGTYDFHIQFSLLKKVHKALARRVDGLVKDGRPIDPKSVYDSHHCMLGKWYYGEGQEQAGNLPAFAGIEGPHEELHRATNAAIAACEKGDEVAAQKALKDAWAASDSLEAALDKLQNSMEQRYDRAA